MTISNRLGQTMSGPPPCLAGTEDVSALKDPSIERTKTRSLVSMMITRWAVISGAKSWDEIEGFGQALGERAPVVPRPPHGTPFHDTLDRVFAALAPYPFQAASGNRMMAVATVLPPRPPPWTAHP